MKMEKIDLKDVQENINKSEKFLIKNEDDIIFLNSLQVNESYMQIFSEINDFSMAEKMLKENPNVKKN